MSFTIIREICTSAENLDVEIMIAFCRALEKLRSSGFTAEVDVIENLVSILFLRLLDSYSSTNMYI